MSNPVFNAACIDFHEDVNETTLQSVIAKFSFPTYNYQDDEGIYFVHKNEINAFENAYYGDE